MAEMALSVIGVIFNFRGIIYLATNAGVPVWLLRSGANERPIYGHQFMLQQINGLS